MELVSSLNVSLLFNERMINEYGAVGGMSIRRGD
jgi:hypothetical protein